MPYINKEERPEIDEAIDSLYLDTAGKMAYAISRLMRKFFRAKMGKIGYADYALVTGVLETAKAELYRRGIAPYEDEKMKQNGDVD